MTDYAIEAKDIWKSFSLGETRIDALRGLSFTLKRGEFVALVGSSGSGKSTLLHLLGALDKPDREANMKNASARQDGLFLVPRVVE